MTRAVVLDLATITNGDLDLSALDAALPGWVGYPVTRADELHARIADAEVVLTNKIRLDRAAFDASPALRLVCLAATGTNNVDLVAARERGIAVANLRGYCTASVAQHVFALILALTIDIPGYRRLLDDGAWRDSPQFCLLDYPVRDLAGKVLGIVGYGELGRATARRVACGRARRRGHRRAQRRAAGARQPVARRRDTAPDRDAAYRVGRARGAPARRRRNGRERTRIPRR